MKYRPSSFMTQQRMTQPGVDMGTAISVGQLITELRQLKTDLLNTTEQKLKEIDNRLKKHLKKVDTSAIVNDAKQQIQEHIDRVSKYNEDSFEERIVARVENRIPEPVDEDALESKILGKIPKIDEKGLTRKILGKIPKASNSLKVVRENVEVDPLSVVEKIMSLPEGKFKLKTAHIDGLDQTLKAFNSQLGRGYLHGGGDTIQAGTNITISRTSAGKTIINSSGGGFTMLTTASIVNGSNQTFVFSSATSQPSLICIDGAFTPAIDNNSTTQWTWNNGTQTATLINNAPTSNIFAIQ